MDQYLWFPYVAKSTYFDRRSLFGSLYADYVSLIWCTVIYRDLRRLQRHGNRRRLLNDKYALCQHDTKMLLSSLNYNTTHISPED